MWSRLRHIPIEFSATPVQKKRPEKQNMFGTTPTLIKFFKKEKKNCRNDSTNLQINVIGHLSFSRWPSISSFQITHSICIEYDYLFAFSLHRLIVFFFSLVKHFSYRKILVYFTWNCLRWMDFITIEKILMKKKKM